MISGTLLWAGVDVGGRAKGFHVALVDEQRLVELRRFIDPISLASWLSERQPSLVAVDSPRAPAPDGERSRSSERALVAARICSLRYTPDTQSLAANPKYYEWIDQGFLLYRELDRFKLEAIECFPTASWTRWAGPRGERRRAEWTRSALTAVGLLAVPRIVSQDDRDAIAAALTARDHEAGKTERFGDIVVPGALERRIDPRSDADRGAGIPRFFIQGAREIASVYDWYCTAPPKKGAAQWQPGRSAMESARAWVGKGRPAVPAEIAALLDTRPETRDFTPILAQPEVVTRLDDFRGEHRNHDLIVVGESEGRRTLVAIEAKADEPFGSVTVAGYLAKNQAISRSNVPARIYALVQGVFGPEALVERDVCPEVGALRYQLLASIAGTIIETRRRWAEQAVFVVHEFLSEDDPTHGYRGTQPRRIEENAHALSSLARACGLELSGKSLSGPFLAHGNERIPAGLPLFLGKASVRVKPYG